MNTVPTSGGIEWTSDGSAYLDAMPIGGPNRQPLSLPQIVAATREMAWQNWTPAMSPTHDLRAFTGVIGINRTANVLLRFIHKRDANPLDALYAIESLDTLPGAIAGCVWAAVTAAPLPQPTGHANAVPSIYARYNARDASSDKPAKRLNRKEIERFVANHINAVVNNKKTEPPDGAVNRARFWIDLSAAMWESDNLRRLGAVANMTLLMPYNELAVMWLAIRPDLTYRIEKQEVHPPIITNGSAWTEAISW